MHKIRRQAYRAGWYSGNDGSWGSNFLTGRSQLRGQTDISPLHLSSSSRPLELELVEESGRARPELPSIVESHELSDIYFSGEMSAQVVAENNIPVLSSPSACLPNQINSYEGQNINTTNVADNAEYRKSCCRFKIASQIKATFGVWLDVLLPFIPAGFAVNYTHRNPATVFVVNFIAIIPMAGAVSFSVDNLSIYLGDVLGGLLSLTFSNIVQLISSIFLLKSRQIPVLRSSLLGAVLQNLSLMTGLAFLCGGINRLEQHFNVKMAQSTGMLLLLAVFSITIPTVSQLWNHTSFDGIVAQSRGTAVVVITSYFLYLVFSLKTHANEFEEPSQKAPKRLSGEKKAGQALRGLAVIGMSGAATAGGSIYPKPRVHEEEEEEKENTTPVISRLFAVITLICSTTLLAFNTQFATDSVQGILQQHNISSTFMGIVILPILSNDPMTVLMAIRDKMDLSILLTLGRCMQAALMVIPLIVLIAWGMGINEMNLDFDGFSVTSMFASILIVTYVIQQGKSNWLMGALFLIVFVIIGLASFYIE